LRVIYEINTDWPLISWPYTIIVVTLTLYAFHLAGPKQEETGKVESRKQRAEISQVREEESGKQKAETRPSTFNFQLSIFSFSPWVKHFFFPVAFILIAVVWPYRIEQALIQGLMRVVAGITVELLGWLDVAAIQRGNLIEVSTGVLGVDEACSGIRSFQSSLMAALLMGELYRFRLWPRAALVAAGIILGFCFNIVRTLILSYQADAQGLSAIDRWHDPAGMTITVACFFSLWALALLMTKWSPLARWSLGSPTSDLRPPSSILRPPDSQPSGNPQPSTTCPATAAINSQPLRPFNFQLSTFSFSFCVGLWSLLCIATTELWYRSHANPNAGVFYWTAAMPETNPTYKKVELPPRTLKLLSFDKGASGEWTEDGVKWSAYFFRWNPDSVQSVIQSRNHRPDVCLPAAGLRQVSESQLEFFEAGNLKLPFRSYVFERQGTLYVFFCQWEDGAEHQAGLEASKQAGRLQSVLTGRRHLGQQSLEVIITGCDGLESAKDKFRQKLPLLIDRGEAKQAP
jgi:exosortase